MRFWFTYRLGLNSSMRVMAVDSYATHEAFVKDLDSRFQEKEVPEACIKKLYPDVNWTSEMSMLWIGKQ